MLYTKWIKQTQKRTLFLWVFKYENLCEHLLRKMTLLALLSQKMSETRRLCVCSCCLPHPTTPCAVSIAGWSRYNCTCFKHALKLPSLYFSSPLCVHS